MRSFTQINRWLHTVVATLAVWSQGFVHDVFTKLNAPNYWLVGTIFIVLVGIQVSDFLTNAAIDHARWFRRLLAGQDDIEGDWVNIVVNQSEPDKIIGAEYCRIRYRGGTFTLSGDTWSLDGKWKHNFLTSGSATYQGRQLEYYYKTGINRVGGFGVILFSPDDALATDFICRYVDEGTKSPHATCGKRLNTRLRKIDLDDRRAAALKFAKEFDQKGLLDLQAALGRPTP